MKQMADEYRRIRNTFRILLGNLADFYPQQHHVPADRLEPVDRWILTELRKVVERCLKAYDEYAFHRVFSTVHNFCTVQLSSIYVDVLKDHMYCDAAESPRRRSSQSAMYDVLSGLARLLAPILVHTTEEVWDHMPGKRGLPSVHFAMMPEPDHLPRDESFEQDWAGLLEVREAVLPFIQQIRYDKKRHSAEEIAAKGLVGSSQEVEVRLRADEKTRQLIERWKPQLEQLLIVSSIELTDDRTVSTPAGKVEGLFVEVRRTRREKCERCWNYRDSVGKAASTPDLCDRCATVVAEL
jgi:isoleucyl-tRNA synthetase